MDRKKTIAGLIALLVFLGISSVGCSSSKSTHMLKIGSKNFTEQVVLGEIIAQHLEHRLQQKVDRRFNLGGTMVAHQAMLSGGIDLYPEYSGTALAAVLKQPFDASHATDSAAVLAQVRSAYERQFHLAWLDPLGINNGFVMVIRGAEARANHMETLSDAAKSSAGWTLGVGYEFDQRADGMGALKSYPLKWTSGTKTMDLGLLYRALAQKQVSMIAANATDGLLSKMDLKPLEDDKHVFPPYELSIVARDESLRDWPGLQAALLELSGKFSNRKMQELNFHVDAEHRPVSRVAADFLHEAGLQ